MMTHNDVRGVSSLLQSDGPKADPNDEVAQIRDYEVSCLDYSFLPTCSKVDELVNLLNVLRSGKEGHYPDLERAFEQRILELNPKYVFKYKQNLSSKPTLNEVTDAAKEFSAWSEAIKATDSALRNTKSGLNKDSAVSVRGSASSTSNPIPIGASASRATPLQNHHKKHNQNDELSASYSCTSSSDYSDSDSDSQNQQQSSSMSSSPPPRSILKSATPPHSNEYASREDRHVRFKDEVEAAARQLERIKRKQERRQRQVELHLAQPVVEKKKKGKKSSSNARPIATTSSSCTPPKSGIMIQEVDNVDETPLSVSAPIPTTAAVSLPKTPSAQPQPQTPVQQQQSNRIKSYDYRSWDKFNVDAELEKLEHEDANKPASSSNATSSARINTSVTIDPKSVPTQVPEDIAKDSVMAPRLADAEKLKGNEAFKAKEYQEALQFYTRSLNLHPTPQVYNNRALTFLKLSQYEKAELDASAALELGSTLKTDTFKSYLRRALARSKRGLYLLALDDTTEALNLFPGDKEAVNLDVEINSKFRDAEGDNAENLLRVHQGLEPLRRETGIKIIEVEDDDDKDDEDDEEVEDEIVTPFGKSCGGAPTTTRTRDVKGKGKTASYPVFETAEDHVEAEVARGKALWEAVKEKREEGLRGVQGYGCSSKGGVSEGEKVETRGVLIGESVEVLKTEEKGSEIEIVDVDFDSDEEEEFVQEKDTRDSAKNVQAQAKNETLVLETKDSAVELKVEDEEAIANVVTEVEGMKDEVQSLPENLPTSVETPQLKSAEKKQVFPLPSTSYEFEAAWKSLKGSEEWTTYVRQIPPTSFPKVLANIGNPSVLPDVFKALNGFVNKQPANVLAVLEEMQKIPRLQLLLKLFTRKEKSIVSELVNSLPEDEVYKSVQKFYV
ncbi:hypothetical protein BCR33DRAFT_772670 [Rhizoclosmatium globosum]|uniref:RNA polymerase II-associated protein 3 n=1 Tax=Rhizoclosmatium globosum TaxID=329046 RepID=A0A1Y2B263_9FUNG|nr:hypothetical protein BCR33DRAFT_772670 [Rhizoclosmatium globosum]|eukprot:ORY28911.1 hypothetical protein BCR33DRAFT_772670 [Rhizoclosmatium globosum]